nr:hypothetical protein [Cellulosimicrobium sp. MM]
MAYYTDPDGKLVHYEADIDSVYTAIERLADIAERQATALERIADSLESGR